ncbi:serine/threonine protein kinase [Microbulbifer aggregans]|uniref:serine/threonine protein kinase n=1 Tax=Microbulbifer aggregans TaxID=1769779 RepID=UPI001CFDB9DE|nr:serine/threonine protein kinase [Microbulbifer aggregans]
MKRVSNKLLLAAAISALLAGCDSGGINIEPQTVDNSVDNSVTNPGSTVENPCAALASGVQGTAEGANCRYGSDFVSYSNPLMEDLYLPALPDGGAHIFDDLLFVGASYGSAADLAAAGITEGGDGPALEIQAGATIAFKDKASFVVINRGSQLFARGTETAPITFTSETDVLGTVGAEDVSQWGGMVINGFGVTNKCVYTGSVAGSDLALAGECSLPAEGSDSDQESNYGGDNNADSSGVMTYVRVKHTGAEVVEGNELNGVTFAGVGSGTVVNNLEAYATYDDGIEMFGGAVNIENYVALYVRDDSIDIDEGWQGSITNALVIQSETDGNHCIEADGIGSYDDMADGTKTDRRAEIVSQGINSRPVIDGLTCIVSAASSTVTHDPGAGWRLREGIYPTITNSMVVASFAADENGAEGSNYCLRIQSDETLAGLVDGSEAGLASNVFACEDQVKGDLPGGVTAAEWATASGNEFIAITGKVDPTANANSEFVLLGGVPAFYTEAAAAQMGVTVSPQERAFLGALSVNGSDWTNGWTYGLHEGSRAQPLWFE